MSILESNTEELREVLQQVYNLPTGGGGGSSEPDLVIGLVPPNGGYLTASNLTNDWVSVKSGSLQSLYTKLQNREEVKVYMESEYYYGSVTYTGIIYPVFVMAVNESDTDYCGVGMEFCVNYTPGSKGSTERLCMFLLLNGTVDYLELKSS